MEILSGDTPMTISLVLTSIGGVAWLTRLHSLSAHNSKRIEELDKDIIAVKGISGAMGERLARMEVSLEALPKIEKFLNDILSRLIENRK